MPRGSRIVNVTSMSGRVPTLGEAFYSAAKAGGVSLSESFTAELATRGIGVTLVLPSEMSTALFAEHASWGLRPDFQRRMEQPPEHVARAIIRFDRVDSRSSPRATCAPSSSCTASPPGLFRRGVGRYYAKLVEPRIGPEGKQR